MSREARRKAVWANVANVKPDEVRKSGLLHYGMTPERYEQAMMWAGLAPAGIIAGQTAKTANLVRLARAKEMAKAKAPREAIWRDTGWYQGPEGQWKFEIPDEASRIGAGAWADIEQAGKYLNKPSVTNADIRAMHSLRDKWRSDDFIHHPELFKQYPELGPMQTALDASMDSKGAFSAEGIALSPAPRKEMHSTMLHELQHAIQQREGFARGGNQESAANTASELMRKVEKRIRDLENSDEFYKASPT